ncbi:MAG: 50S ribosomal protein L34 [Caldisericia bacterium]|nr:50S ribosomal protein L34 [Caldisericia bacterium]
MRTTYHPHKGKRRKVHGFLKRMSTPGGRNVIKRRRRKGRRVLTPR